MLKKTLCFKKLNVESIRSHTQSYPSTKVRALAKDEPTGIILLSTTFLILIMIIIIILIYSEHRYHVFFNLKGHKSGENNTFPIVCFSFSHFD